MEKEKIYRITAIAMSGLSVLFGVLFLLFSAKWYTLNKNVRSLETMLTEAVKETSQLKTQIRTLSSNQAKQELEYTGGGELSDSQEDDGEAKDEDDSSKMDKTKADPSDAELSPSEEKDAVADLTLLEPQLDSMLTEARSSAGGRWSIYIKNLSSGITAQRENSQMKAASLFKLFIMGAVCEQYDTLASANGSESIDNLLNAMITVSDNDAANQLVTILGNGDSAAGRQTVSTYCSEHGFSSTSMGRMLLEESPTGENYTSVEDCAAFLETLYLKEFDYSDKMLSLLEAQQRRSKIPAQIPDGVTIANKTGELPGIENDAAIVYGDKNPYIICIMTDGLTDSTLAVNYIASMSGNIYGFFNQ